jgi:signal peptidase I
MPVKRILALFLIGLPILMYALNPFGTATLDPRARILGYTSYRIPSNSMSPTLQVSDYILVSAAAYASEEPDTNDIIVHRYPPKREIEYAKRVVAKEGEILSIKNGQVIVDDKALDQWYVDEVNMVRTRQEDFGPVEIPPNMLFVLGDNRDSSNDSRYWGFVPREDVVGKVIIIWASDDEARIGEVK